MKDLKNVYRADTKDLEEEALKCLEDKWGKKYSIVIESWQNNWEELSAYFEYTKPIRKLIYTTNTVEGYPPSSKKSNQDKRSVYKRYGAFKTSLFSHTKYPKNMDCTFTKFEFDSSVIIY